MLYLISKIKNMRIKFNNIKSKCVNAVNIKLFMLLNI